MYDVIVVGARCAGSPMAMLLGRLGYRVLLVDKATFPSDVPRGHLIQPSGVARLQRWGLLDEIAATGCPPIAAVHFDAGPFVSMTPPPMMQEGELIFGPRRSTLDKLLVDAAARAGAEVREGFSVQEILLDEGRVVGIRGHALHGETVTEKASIVVGADGMRSLVARTVQAPTYETRPARSCVYFSYWSGVPIDACEIYMYPHRAIFAFPTNDHLTCIAVEWPVQELRAVREDIEGSVLKTIALLPSLAERVQAGRREERFMFDSQ